MTTDVTASVWARQDSGLLLFPRAGDVKHFTPCYFAAVIPQYLLGVEGIVATALSWKLRF